MMHTLVNLLNHNVKISIGRSAVIGKWNDSPDTVLPIIRRLLKAGLRIWIYRYIHTCPKLVFIQARNS